jgi:hypothetical protein
MERRTPSSATKSNKLNVEPKLDMYLSMILWFQINLGLPTVCYLIVPFMFIMMAAKGSWKGTYQVSVSCGKTLEEMKPG